MSALFVTASDSGERTLHYVRETINRERELAPMKFTFGPPIVVQGPPMQIIFNDGGDSTVRRALERCLRRGGDDGEHDHRGS